jgi:hypothetical protein
MSQPVASTVQGGEDSNWIDDATTPEEEYQRRYYRVVVPKAVNVRAISGSKRNKKKRKRDGRIVVEDVGMIQDRFNHHDNEGGDSDSDMTAGMSDVGRGLDFVGGVN